MTKQYIFIFGYGKIGKKVAEYIKEHDDLCLVGYANSKKMWINDIEYTTNGDAKPFLKRIINYKHYIKNIEFTPKNKIFVDCTSLQLDENNVIYQEVAYDYYSMLLENDENIKIITANRNALCCKTEIYNKLQPYLFTRIKFETTICPQLPVVNTINKMMKSSKILKIEGILSGTINLILTTLHSFDLNFSDIVSELWKNGYTEKDTYRDLCGLNVAKKLLIIGRLFNNNLKFINIQETNLLFTDSHDFFNIDTHICNIKIYDEIYREKTNNAKQKNKKLKYISKFDVINNILTTDLESVDISSPYYHIDDAHNIILITTDKSKHSITFCSVDSGISETACSIITEILT